MEQSDVRGTIITGFWGFLSRTFSFSVDRKLFSEPTRTRERAQKRDNQGTCNRKGKGNSRTGKNPRSLTSTVGKGERGIAEICDQINATADELLTCIRQ